MSALLGLGIPVAYLLLGMFFSRFVYSFLTSKSIDSTDVAIASVLTFFFWPISGIGFVVYYFVTNGVRKQRNKPKARRSS